MLVGQRMTKNPLTVASDTPVSEAQILMRKEKIHRFPVLDKHEKLVGIVTEKDLLYASPSPATTLDVYEMTYLLSRLKVSEVMSQRLITVTPDTPVEEAAKIMIDNDIGGLPVLEGSTLAGIITESDLFRIFCEMFGTRQTGLRATLLVPEEKGEIAHLASAIAGKGGNILALGTFLGPEADQGLMTLKVSDLSEADFRQAVAPWVKSIVDLRRI